MTTQHDDRPTEVSVAADAGERSHYLFSWDKLGNIAEGRQHLGESMPVLVYRMLEYSTNNVLFETFGREKCDDLLRRAGWLAGTEFAKHMLPLDETPSRFLTALHTRLAELKVGILRVEKADFENGELVVTVHEDLDCSGLPESGELVCRYDEGFIAGIIEAYSGCPYRVREVDCWSSGARVCRFRGSAVRE